MEIITPDKFAEQNLKEIRAELQDKLGTGNGVARSFCGLLSTELAYRKDIRIRAAFGNSSTSKEHDRGYGAALDELAGDLARWLRTMGEG